MRHKSLTVALAAIALASVVAVQALAQGGPGHMRERGWGMWDDDRGTWRDGPFWRRWGRGPDRMLERLERRLSYLKSDFAITEAQTDAWNELAQTIRTAAKQRYERMKAFLADDAKAKTLPERVDLLEQFMVARLEEVKQIKASLQGLYAILTDDQKKKADAMVLPMVGMGGRWGM
jgi:hypothetical protein